MILLLLALLLSQPPSAAPRVDEGPRWQTATLVKTFNGKGPQDARLIFWRLDAFGESQPAGSVEWSAVISWHDEGDGFRFLWWDESDKCYRQLKAPEWFRLDVNLDTCRFDWPRCRNQELFGFLPNPEAPIYP